MLPFSCVVEHYAEWAELPADRSPPRRTKWEFSVSHGADILDSVELHFPHLSLGHGLRITDLIERVAFTGTCYNYVSMTGLDLLIEE